MIMFYIGNMYCCTPNKQTKKCMYILYTHKSVSLNLQPSANKKKSLIEKQYWSELCMVFCSSF